MTYLYVLAHSTPLAPPSSLSRICARTSLEIAYGKADEGCFVRISGLKQVAPVRSVAALFAPKTRTGIPVGRKRSRVSGVGCCRLAPARKVRLTYRCTLPTTSMRSQAEHRIIRVLTDCVGAFGSPNVVETMIASAHHAEYSPSF